jgi:hypothetical protein
MFVFTHFENCYPASIPKWVYKTTVLPDVLSYFEGKPTGHWKQDAKEISEPKTGNASNLAYYITRNFANYIGLLPLIR